MNRLLNHSPKLTQSIARPLQICGETNARNARSYRSEVVDMVLAVEYGLIPGIDTCSLKNCKVCNDYMPMMHNDFKMLPASTEWWTKWLSYHDKDTYFLMDCLDTALYDIDHGLIERDKKCGKYCCV